MKTYLLIIIATFTAVFSHAGAQQPTTKKPPVGVPVDATLFNGKWYRTYLEKTTWKRAQEKCRTLGGQLACVPDAPTQAFIAGYAKGLELWIGATDEKVEGQWLWVDGTEMKYKAWGKNEPTLSRNDNVTLIGTDGRWYDGPDNWPCVGFVCEWKAK